MASGTLFPAQTDRVKSFDNLDDNVVLVNTNNPGAQTGSANLNWIQALLLGGPYDDIRCVFPIRLSICASRVDGDAGKPYGIHTIASAHVAIGMPWSDDYVPAVWCHRGMCPVLVLILVSI